MKILANFQAFEPKTIVNGSKWRAKRQLEAPQEAPLG